MENNVDGRGSVLVESGDDQEAFGVGAHNVAHAVYFAHPARSDRREVFVGSKTRACGKGHPYWNYTLAGAGEHRIGHFRC